MNKLGEAMKEIEKLSVIEGFFKPSDYYEAEGAKKCLSILRNVFSGGAYVNVSRNGGLEFPSCVFYETWGNLCRYRGGECVCIHGNFQIGNHAKCLTGCETTLGILCCGDTISLRPTPRDSTRRGKRNEGRIHD